MSHKSLISLVCARLLPACPPLLQVIDFPRFWGVSSPPSTNVLPGPPSWAAEPGT